MKTVLVSQTALCTNCAVYHISSECCLPWVQALLFVSLCRLHCGITAYPATPPPPTPPVFSPPVTPSRTGGLADTMQRMGEWREAAVSALWDAVSDCLSEIEVRSVWWRRVALRTYVSVLTATGACLGRVLYTRQPSPGADVV